MSVPAQATNDPWISAVTQMNVSGETLVSWRFQDVALKMYTSRVPIVKNNDLHSCTRFLKIFMITELMQNNL